jgi:peroxiredoxin
MTTGRRIISFIKVFADTWWPIAILTVLVVTVVYQHWEYAHPVRAKFLKEGDRIADVTLETPTKQRIPIKWEADGKATIVYLFTPTCVWCRRNIEAMRALEEAARDYHFIAVSLTRDGVSDYIAANHLTFPVFVADEVAAKHLSARVTPSTIVISPKGVVKYFWPGVYIGKNGKEIEQAFNVKLPRVTSE